jgi:hypothetical protein
MAKRISGGISAGSCVEPPRRFFRGATNTKTVRGPQQPQGKSPGNTVPGGRILNFVSRAEHLALRARWKNGRWVKLSWTPEERSAILRQDETYRQTDARWQVNHGPIPGGARVWAFSAERSTRPGGQATEIQVVRRFACEVLTGDRD